MTNQNLEPDEPAGTDVTSDPARDDTTGSDWSTEGGATADGPATNTGHHRQNGAGQSGNPGLAGILPLIIMSALAILVVVWLFVH